MPTHLIPKPRRTWRIVMARAAVAMAVTVTLPLTVAAADDGETTFKQQCASCHTIGGGRLVGPDLKGVTERQTRDWLVGFIVDPSRYLASDSYAKTLLKEANGVPMPALPGMTAQKAGAVLDYIESAGTAATGTDGASDGDGVHEGDWTWYTPENVQKGRDLFVGRTRLSGGAPACSSCHASARAGVFRNGSLGPDLTSVYARLGSRRGLKAWLSSPPTAVMGTVFGKHPLTPEEVDHLTAFFADNNTKFSDGGIFSGVALAFSGLLGAVLMLGALDVTWAGRLRKVREVLIEMAAKGIKGKKS